MIPTYTSARRTWSRQYRAGLPASAGKYSMSSTASPARLTARSAAAANDRSAGNSRSSEVWLKNTRRASPMVCTLSRAGRQQPVHGLESTTRTWPAGAGGFYAAAAATRREVLPGRAFVTNHATPGWHARDMRHPSCLPPPAAASRLCSARPGRSRTRPPRAAAIPGRAAARPWPATSTLFSGPRSGGTRMAVQACSFPGGCGA